MKFWDMFFCKHEGDEFIRNIYGDEINAVSLKTVYRSWWRCRKCGNQFPKQELVSTHSKGIQQRLQPDSTQ